MSPATLNPELDQSSPHTDTISDRSLSAAGPRLSTHSLREDAQSASSLTVLRRKHEIISISAIMQGYYTVELPPQWILRFQFTYSASKH